VSNEEWVIVSFQGSEEEMPGNWLNALLPTEMAAIEALESADIGTIDGNDIGDHEYQLYFVGDDRHAVWEVLAPIFAEAPVAWSRVELRRNFEDPNPDVITK
jgi:hypothetical protein